MKIHLFLAIISVFGTLVVSDPENATEEEVKEFLKQANEVFREQVRNKNMAQMSYETNLTDANEAKMLTAFAEADKILKKEWEELVRYPFQSYEDEDVRRQFRLLKNYMYDSTNTGKFAISDEKRQKLDSIIAEMTNIFESAKVCDYSNRTKCDLSIDTGLLEVYDNSGNEDELKYLWVEFHKQTAKGTKPLYEEYVKLSNEAATLLGFPDAAAQWIDQFETDNFLQLLQKLWNQLKPFYQQLHAYVRTKTRKFFGDEFVPKCGLIPMHLLGGLWGQSWISYFGITIPYKDVKIEDVSANLVRQGYTPLKLAKLAEEFFTSMGMPPMSDIYWKKSIFEKPPDRDILCSPGSWDFYEPGDYNTVMCMGTSFNDLMSVQHEQGFCEYFMAYENLPFAYRNGANLAFHQAIGDTIETSVSSSTHLHRIGLMSTSTLSPEADVNNLFLIALDKIASLPFALSLDLWRYGVFNGTFQPDKYNDEWWRIKNEYQGASRPVKSTKDDFDPPSIYHIAANYPYMVYFISYIIQYQFYESLCVKAKQYDPGNPESKPLHQCDIYQSVEAGNLFESMLQLGASKPWPDAMELLTGQREIDAASLLAYFGPVIKWLEDENSKNNECIGWDEA